MGVNVQVCWDKFCRYWESSRGWCRWRASASTSTPSRPPRHCDENTIGVVAILGSTFDGSYEPVAEIAAALDALAAGGGPDVPLHVDAASGGFIAPFLQPDLVWDFQLPRVQSINASGHKYGLVYPGVGWALWRDAEALPEELVFKVNYLGGEMPTFALNFSRPGSEVIAQYFMFLSLGREGFTAVQAELERGGPAHRHRGRGDRAVPHDHRRQRAAGLRVRDQARDRPLHRLRRVRPAARARLARAGLHVPGEPRGPVGAARRRARRA